MTIQQYLTVRQISKQLGLTESASAETKNNFKNLLKEINELMFPEA